MKNPNRRFSFDDELFAIALAIPALFAAARYIDSEREKSALARLQEARTTAVVKATTLDDPRFYHKPLASRMQPSGEQISNATREFMNAYFETPKRPFAGGVGTAASAPHVAHVQQAAQGNTN